MRFAKLFMLVALLVGRCFSAQISTVSLIYHDQKDVPIEIRIEGDRIRLARGSREKSGWIRLEDGTRIDARKNHWEEMKLFFPDFECSPSIAIKENNTIKINNDIIIIKENFSSTGSVHYWKGFYIIEVLVEGWGVPGRPAAEGSRPGFYHSCFIAYNKRTHSYQFFDANHVGLGLLLIPH